jgi:recombination protein RecR
LSYSESIARLIDELRKLPSIGPKSAQRLAFYLLKAEDVDVRNFVRVIEEAKARTIFCSVCGNVTESDPCTICCDQRRDQTIVCVVEEFRDVFSIERTREYKGLYHVLHGAISPMEGIGPEKLRIRELLNRVGAGGIKEVILATDPNIEGETTAMYIARLLAPLGIVVTRVASGLPVGGDLEYADDATLAKAMAGRREMP